MACEMLGWKKGESSKRVKQVILNTQIRKDTITIMRSNVRIKINDPSIIKLTRSDKQVTCDKRTVCDGDSTVGSEQRHASRLPPVSGDPCNSCTPSGSSWRHGRALSVRDRTASVCSDQPRFRRRCHFRRRPPSWPRNRSCRSTCARRHHSTNNTDRCERYHCRRAAAGAAETRRNRRWWAAGTASPVSGSCWKDSRDWRRRRHPKLKLRRRCSRDTSQTVPRSREATSRTISM